VPRILPSRAPKAGAGASAARAQGIQIPPGALASAGEAADEADTWPVQGFRIVIATALVAAALFPADAAAVKSGRYKGPDISFRVKKNKISKLTVVTANSCQTIGSGDLPNGDIQTFTPPGRFKIRRSGRFSGSRYVTRVNDFLDIRFAWRGRIRKGRMKARIQTMYKYYDTSSNLVSCYGENVYRAKRVR
jgi:hypothetical protein